MSQSFNGYAAFNMTRFIRTSLVLGDGRKSGAPDTTKCFVFLDVHDVTRSWIRNSAYRRRRIIWIPTFVVGRSREPACNQGCNFSFADGHAETLAVERAKGAVTYPRGFHPAGRARRTGGLQPDGNRVPAEFELIFDSVHLIW